MPELTAENRSNLEKLASYLEKLPSNYGHFGMSTWLLARNEKAELKYARQNGGVPECGTVACAVGHGPAAGIFVPEHCISSYGRERVLWWPYAALFYGDTPRSFDWLFSADWRHADNTHHGAAARIRYLLDKGEPPARFRGPSRHYRKLYAPYHLAAKAQADA